MVGIINALSHADISATIDNVAATIIATSILGGVGWLIRDSRHQRKDLKDQGIDLKRVIVALAGESADDLHPDREPGLIEKVKSIDIKMDARKELGDNLMAEFSDIKAILDERGVHMTDIENKVDSLDSTVQRLFSNGLDTNDPGDVQARIAQGKKPWLDESEVNTKSREKAS